MYVCYCWVLKDDNVNLYKKVNDTKQEATFTKARMTAFVYDFARYLGIYEETTDQLPCIKGMFNWSNHLQTVCISLLGEDRLKFDYLFNFNLTHKEARQMVYDLADLLDLR